MTVQCLCVSMQLCPLPHPRIQTRSPNRELGYVNLPVTVPTVSSGNVSTPINAPHLPTTDNSRHFEQHSPMLNERLETDFHTFPGNGHYSGSGFSSNMSSVGTGSQPGSTPALDPNLKCTGCEKQFREGEIQEFKRHSSVCEKRKSRVRQPFPVTFEVGYHEDFHTGEQSFDPNLTCLGCDVCFKETQIQEFKKHCQTCAMFKERRSQSESNVRRGDTSEGEVSMDVLSKSLCGGRSRLS